MNRSVRAALNKFIRAGNLKIKTARGPAYTFGDGSGERVAIRFTTWAAEWGVILDPALRLGESYMNGTMVVERGSIAEVLAILQGQAAGAPFWAQPWHGFRYLRRRLEQFNRRRRARRNVAHHYDLDGRLYSLFLDADRQYSCAYFETADQSLDDAQLAKRRHLAAKLLITPSQRLLDIGCGWGGLSLYLSETCGCRVTGVTLSREQFGVARGRAEEKGLADTVEFRLQDYRDVPGTFDRIVSVGMFEHVGVGFYDAFFRKCSSMLADDGIMLLHAIGRPEGPNATNPWIAKYIFPGGYIPALSEVLTVRVERAGLLVTDIEILRLHGVETPGRPGGSASWHTGRTRNGFTTGASCGCGSSIWRLPKWRFASRP